MASRRTRRHIVIEGRVESVKYRPHRQGGSEKNRYKPENRSDHGAALADMMRTVVREAKERNQEYSSSGIVVHGAEPGIYVQFESQPGTALALSSLERLRQKIELVAVTHSVSSDSNARSGDSVERATVFVPLDKEEYFNKCFREYTQATDDADGKRSRSDMLDPIACFYPADLRSLWTDSSDAYPSKDEAIWWEVWLRRSDGNEFSRVKEFANAQSIEVISRCFVFPERVVCLVRATPVQLAASLHVLSDIAELQRAREAVAPIIEANVIEQAEWVKDLRSRITKPRTDAAFVCILDTGVNRGHPLLSDALASDDCTAVDPGWGDHDHHGHGTLMAGLSLFGDDLGSLLASSQPVSLEHQLESVKILPPGSSNPKELYCAVTAEAVGRAEINAPFRRRCFAMAVTSKDNRDRGLPTSWSAAVDALAVGRLFETSSNELLYPDNESQHRIQRLFVVSAGNVECLNMTPKHLDISDSTSVHDPAQAWNALTVGAFTNKVLIQDESFRGWIPLAPAGELSPYSTTSVPFAKQWPIKPDIVLEGGNVAYDQQEDFVSHCADLCLLSTHYEPSKKLFDISQATSAATAQAARLCAIASAQYPNLWPESIRGLLVHASTWTDTMKANFERAGSAKKQRELLVRRYGFGVPDIGRVLRSANDSLTLITQNVICPFAVGASKHERNMGDIHFIDFPWPTDILQDLKNTQVRLRVTLSYFIDPNPGRRGWQKRHRYASYGLRFEVKSPTESADEFKKRLNSLAMEKGEKKQKSDGTDDWYLGKIAREKGSIHSDFLNDTAAKVAARNIVGVYPVSGWWKDMPKHDRSHSGVRYSLIVSIDTPVTDVDIWTPVANIVGIPITT